MDPQAHRRFLDYRERFSYFEKELRAPMLSYDEFAAAEVEQRALEARADARDDEEEARFVELTKRLLLD
ncbi:MAG TPA: hypothetical protein VN894_06225 [Polyangiaceae bacterium]|nr:hypothetical protein [Polyangiaceae bacterium]